MSLNELNLDVFKPWLNARVCNLTVDCDANIPNLRVAIDQIESSGTPGFLVDDGVDIIRRDILLQDLQDIGVTAPPGETFLKHQAGVVSFVPVPSDESIYSTDGVIADPVREVDVNGGILRFRNPDLVQIGESTDAYLQVTQNFGGGGQPGCGFTKSMAPGIDFFSACGDLGSGATALVGYNSATQFHSCQAYADHAEIQSTDQTALVTESIKVDGGAANPLASVGQISIESNAVVLVKPLADTPGVDKILVRSPASGLLSERDVSSLPSTPAVPIGFPDGVFMSKNGQAVTAATTKLVYAFASPGSYNTGIYNTGTGDLTIPAGGAQIWRFEASTGYEENGAHGNLNQELVIYKNAVRIATCEDVYEMNINDVKAFRTACSCSCTTGDIITVEFISGSTGLTETLPGGTTANFAAYRIK